MRIIWFFVVNFPNSSVAQNEWEDNSGFDKLFIVYSNVSAVFAAIFKKLHRTSEQEKEGGEILSREN